MPPSSICLPLSVRLLEVSVFFMLDPFLLLLAFVGPDTTFLCLTFRRFSSLRVWDDLCGADGHQSIGTHMR